MADHTRRTFLLQTAGTAALAAVTSGRAAGANERYVIGVIGPGGMGTNLLRSFAAMKDVEVAYVCDIDAGRMNGAASEVEKIAKKAPKGVKDLRQVLDDKAVDAVVIATPDHWHVAGHDSGVRGREARVRREAGVAQHPRRAA